MKIVKVKRTKFNNIRTIIDGISFPSKKEGTRYIDLKMLKERGDVESFDMQVTYKFASGIKYILDFLVKWNDGSITHEDVKGVRTPVYIIKKKLMKHEFGIDILEI